MVYGTRSERKLKHNEKVSKTENRWPWDIQNTVCSLWRLSIINQSINQIRVVPRCMSTPVINVEIFTVYLFLYSHLPILMLNNNSQHQSCLFNTFGFLCYTGVYHMRFTFIAEGNTRQKLGNPLSRFIMLYVTCISYAFTRDRCHIHVVHLHTYYTGVTQDILSPITVKSSISLASSRQRRWASVVRPIETLSIETVRAVFWHFNNSSAVSRSVAWFLLITAAPTSPRAQQCSIYRFRHFSICPKAAGVAKWPINGRTSSRDSGVGRPETPSSVLLTPPVTYSHACMTLSRCSIGPLWFHISPHMNEVVYQQTRSSFL